MGRGCEPGLRVPAHPVPGSSGPTGARVWVAQGVLPGSRSGCRAVHRWPCGGLRWNDRGPSAERPAGGGSRSVNPTRAGDGREEKGGGERRGAEPGPHSRPWREAPLPRAAPNKARRGGGFHATPRRAARPARGRGCRGTPDPPIGAARALAHGGARNASAELRADLGRFRTLDSGSAGRSPGFGEGRGCGAYPALPPPLLLLLSGFRCLRPGWLADGRAGGRTRDSAPRPLRLLLRLRLRLRAPGPRMRAAPPRAPGRTHPHPYLTTPSSSSSSGPRPHGRTLAPHGPEPRPRPERKCTGVSRPRTSGLRHAPPLLRL